MQIRTELSTVSSLRSQKHKAGPRWMLVPLRGLVPAGEERLGGELWGNGWRILFKVTMLTSVEWEYVSGLAQEEEMHGCEWQPLNGVLFAK